MVAGNPTFQSSVFSQDVKPTASSSSAFYSKNFSSSIFSEGPAVNRGEGKKCFAGKKWEQSIDVINPKPDEPVPTPVDVTTGDHLLSRKHFAVTHEASIGRLSAEVPTPVTPKEQPPILKSSVGSLLRDPSPEYRVPPSSWDPATNPSLANIGRLGHYCDQELEAEQPHCGRARFPLAHTAQAESNPGPTKFVHFGPTHMHTRRRGPMLRGAEADPDKPTGKRHVAPVRHEEPEGHLLSFGHGLPQPVPKKQHVAVQHREPTVDSVSTQIVQRYEKSSVKSPVDLVREILG